MFDRIQAAEALAAEKKPKALIDYMIEKKYVPLTSVCTLYGLRANYLNEAKRPGISGL